MMPRARRPLAARTASLLRRCLAAAALALSPQGAASAEFTVLTAADNTTIPAELMVVRLTGDITTGAAAELSRAWSSRDAGIARLLLDLDSVGGELAETERIIALVQDLRQAARVDTLVRHGATCASACVAIFAQGERRSAGGASAWVFHGVCPAGSSLPSFAATCRGLDLLRAAGVSEDFLQMLLHGGFLTRPGALWLSGYELHHIHEAGLITRLLDSWQPDHPGNSAPPSGISPQ